jgi:hypothetical protein
MVLYETVSARLAFPALIVLGRDVRCGPDRLNLPPNGIASIALDRQYDAAGRQVFEQQRAC